ncbi:DUF1749 domain-containing protein [Candidatus Pacearchaeota archaeon]|nr:DUF1749 domain-containing protein [Candidatus Pacearchaeota archaeon]
MNKCYIIHRWSGSPEEEIHKWLKKELERRGFEVHALEMPNPEEPKIEEWVSFLKQKAPKPGGNTFFVGHSIGCQTILRYLESLPSKTKVGGVILIAPWVHLLDTAFEEPEEESKIARPWLEMPINWKKAKAHANNFICVFSDDDFCVPLSDKEIFKEKLNAKIIVEHNKGHFTMEDNIDKVPSALNALLEMIK